MKRKVREYERKVTAQVRSQVMPLQALMQDNSAAILAGEAEDIALHIAATLETAGVHECNITASAHKDVAAVIAQARRVAVMYGLNAPSVVGR